MDRSVDFEGCPVFGGVRARPGRWSHPPTGAAQSSPARAPLWLVSALMDNGRADQVDARLDSEGALEGVDERVEEAPPKEGEARADRRRRTTRWRQHCRS